MLGHRRGLGTEVGGDRMPTLHAAPLRCALSREGLEEEPTDLPRERGGGGPRPHGSTACVGCVGVVRSPQSSSVGVPRDTRRRLLCTLPLSRQLLERVTSV